MTVVVSDTTPLNYLILIGNIDILPKLFGKIFVPSAVIEELNHPQTPKAVSAWAERLPDWIEVRRPCTDLHLGIGFGEDQAISLAVELGGGSILTDDRKAVAAAQSRGLLVFRTLAILDYADTRGLIDFESAVVRLRATTFRMEEAILQETLKSVRSRKSHTS